VRPEHYATLCILFAEINLGKLIDRVITATMKAPKSTARLGHLVGMQQWIEYETRYVKDAAVLFALQ